jgi:hypothetical protein
MRDIVRDAPQWYVIVCLQKRRRFAHVESAYKGQFSQLGRSVSMPD